VLGPHAYAWRDGHQSASEMADRGGCSLGVLLSGGCAGSAPGLVAVILLVIVTVTSGTVFEALHGVGNGSVLGLSLSLTLLSFTFFAVGLDLLGVGVSEHEQVNHDVPRLIAGDVALELEGLTSEEPEHVGNGEARLVVGRDGNINPVKRRVRIAKGNDGDVHVGGLSEGLVVKAGIADDHESGLKVLLSVLVSQCAWDPLSTHVVGAGMRGKLEHGSLGENTGGNNKDILLVLLLDSSDDSGGNHGLLPRFGQVEVEDTIPSAIVNVRFHLRVTVLGSDVHLGGDHVDDIIVLVIRVQK